MTFKSFLTRLFFLGFLLVGLLFAIQTQRSGIENLFVFVIGYAALSTLVVRFMEGANSVFPVSAGWFGRAGLVVLVLLRLYILITLVENGHFVAACLATLVTLAHWIAFTEVLSAERELKEFAVRTSQGEAAFSAPLEPVDSGSTATLDKLTEPDNRVGFEPIYGGTALGQP